MKKAGTRKGMPNTILTSPKNRQKRKQCKAD